MIKPTLLQRFIKNRLFLGILFLAVFSLNGLAQDTQITYEHPDHPPTMNELLKWKEVFTYEVKFGFFKLGKVQTQILRDTTYRGQKVWWLRTKITSNPSIPFVGHEENHYNTFFVKTDSLPYTALYWRDDIDDRKFKAERYRFDYDNKKVYYSEQGKAVDTLSVTEPSSSGQLIFYYSRLFAGTNKPYRLPVYLEDKMGYINGRNTTNTEMRKYDAFDQPVKTYYSYGDADIDGPFGFKGKYKAWYLADDLRVPVEAHAKVWLGNVKVKLIDYKKEPRKE